MLILSSRQDITAWLASNGIERIIIISPHLDDAVLSLGGMINAVPEITEVITVHTEGTPGEDDAWAKICGFDDSAAEHRSRKIEDQRAMEHIGCRYQHLGLRSGELTEATAWQLARTLGRSSGATSASTLVMLPAGAGGHRSLSATKRWLRRMLRRPFGSVAHPDHESSRDCFRNAFSELPARLCFYAEIPYCWNEHPMRLAKRISALLTSPLDHVRIKPDLHQKLVAAECYNSQADLILGRTASYRRRVLRSDEHLFLAPKKAD